METDKIAKWWRANAELDLHWRRSSNQTSLPGEARGFEVESVGIPSRRAYLKPTKPASTAFGGRAAREKICSDLAHDLGITVPPVILARRPDAPMGEETNVCVSLFMFPLQFPWGEVVSMIEDSDELAGLFRSHLPTASAMGLAFDTWVDQPDHGESANNITFGTDGRSSSYVFLDYAMTLGYGGGWTSTPTEIPMSDFPRRMKDSIDKSVLTRTIRSIEDFAPGEIANVVGRIPREFMGQPEQDSLVKGLIARRGLVGTALKDLVS